jgi:hypothetical protein
MPSDPDEPPFDCDEAIAPNDHVQGMAYSLATYNHGCRCPECVAVKVAYMRVMKRADARAATWVRRNEPTVWQELVDEAYDHHGMVRQPRGNPGKTRPDQRRGGGRDDHPTD